jgi:tetratricopeptide (TPR) repeat protein
MLIACTCLALGLPDSAPAQDIPETSPEAIAAHAEGLRLYLATDYRAAMPHFLRAHELDPTFVTPLYIGSIVAGNAGMTAVRDSLWTLVVDHRDQFSDYYQRMIDAIEAGKARDLNRRDEIVASVVRDYPGTKAAYSQAYWAMGRNHAAVAVKSLTSLDPDREPMKGWWPYHSVLANAQHALGDFDSEIAAARAGMESHPDRVAPRAHLARALASAGRVDEIDAVLSECADLDDPQGWNMGYALSWVGGELLAHGDLDAAQPYLDKTVAWWEGLPADERSTAANRRNHAYALYAAGRYAEAQKEYAGLAKDYPKAIADRMRLGASAALAGDEATARESLRMIEAGEINDDPPTMHGYASFITAALGDEDATLRHLEQTWVGARWIHVEPAYIRGPMKDNARLKAFMKPTG